MFKKIIISLALFLIPCFVMAASVKLDNPVRGVESLFNVSNYVGQVIGNVLKIIGSVSLLLLIYGGFLIIMSGGSEAKVKEGRSIITYTAIGLVVIFSAYIILTFFLGALGGTIYNEYYDMPGSSGEATTITEPSSCPVDCSPSLACDVQEVYCQAAGCCVKCPANCQVYKACIGINQPAECMDVPGCCGMTAPNN